MAKCDTNKITLAITTYKEKDRALGEWAMRAASVAADHPLVDDIVMVNDASGDVEFLRKVLLGIPKVRILQNKINLGMFGNKVCSIEASRNPWVVMCDSDNFMGVDYFDCLAKLIPWQPNVWYCPSFGRPMLDYRHFHGEYGMKEFVELVGRKQFGCLLNTGNQFVHRQSFLEAFKGYRKERFDLDQPDYFGAKDRKNIKWRRIHDGADCAFSNAVWLRQGGVLNVVEGLHYVHNCTPQSFDSAPKEKIALHPLYLCEMKDILSLGHVRSYTLLRIDRYQNCPRRIYKVDGVSELAIWGPDYRHIEEAQAF